MPIVMQTLIMRCKCTHMPWWSYKHGLKQHTSCTYHKRFCVAITYFYRHLPLRLTEMIQSKTSNPAATIRTAPLQTCMPRKSLGFVALLFANAAPIGAPIRKATAENAHDIPSQVPSLFGSGTSSGRTVAGREAKPAEKKPAGSKQQHQRWRKQFDYRIVHKKRRSHRWTPRQSNRSTVGRTRDCPQSRSKRLRSDAPRMLQPVDRRDWLLVILPGHITPKIAMYASPAGRTLACKRTALCNPGR
jgi:hypothetical protein